MLKYMTLIRGDSEITYPIYQISDLSKLAFSVAGTSSDSIKFVAYGGNPTATPGGIQTAFADEIPVTPADYGNITQNAMRFILDTATQKQYCPSAHFVVVPVGEKPVDWNTNYFDYFEYQAGQVGNWGNVPVAVEPATNPREIPVWSNTAQYYKSDTPTLQERFNHLFFTKAGYSFGVWSMSGQGEGAAAYCHASYIACNPRANAVMQDSYSYIWRDQNGNSMGHQSITQAAYYAYWRTNCMDIVTPAAGAVVSTTSLTSDRRDMQIFCYCEYNGEMYYGVMAIAIDSNGELTNARALMFTADFWGDSISDYNPEGSGEWGEDSTSGGGDGTFSFDSQDHGDIDNASISTARYEINAAFSNLATGIHAYQLDANAMEKIVAVLYSSDYLTRIEAGNYNPLSCVLSYHLLPSQFRNFDTGARDVVAGGYNFTYDPPSEYRVPAQKICLHAQEVKFTKKIIGKHFGAFPDFAPYTQAIMHLPYVGVIELDVNAFMYGEISVAYLCDCYTGNVAAYVTCKDHMNHVTQKYVGTGNCAYSLPIFSENQSAQTLGRTLVSTGTSVASTVAALNMGAPFLSNERMLKGRIARYGVGSALESGGSLAEMAILGIPKVPEIHGEFGGNVGLVADDTVWMEIIRPMWSNPSDYQALNGIPSNTSTKLSNCSGFTQVTSIEIEGCTATADEVEELKSILESGIIIRQV